MLRRKNFYSLTSAFLFALALNGCNSSGQSENVTHKGSVGDGPVTGATIIVADKDGVVLLTDTSDSTANYEINLDVDSSSYPLQIVATGGVDLVTRSVPDFTLMSVVTSPAQTTVNINPFSTLVAQMAATLPDGLTSSNVETAENIVMSNFAFGLNENILADPFRTPITPANIADIVKSSESFGETVRRTRDSLQILGRDISGDQIMGAMAADIVDGKLDGVGLAATDPHVSALFNVISGQVLIEAMGNKLKVGGVDATTAMNDAIRATLPGVQSAPKIADVQISGRLIEQTRQAISAAAAVSSDPELSMIGNVVDSANENSSPAEFESLLPGNSDVVLENAISAAVFATDTQISSINAIGGLNATTGITLNLSDKDNQPFARPDSASVKAGESIDLAVLGNDTGLQDSPLTVQVQGMPANGTVTISSNNVITYKANKGYTGSDSFSYRITDADGDSSVATISIDIDCAVNCSSPSKLVQLAWNPVAGNVAGYLVYYGSGPATVNQKVSDVVTPEVTLDIGSDLNASDGDNVCFQVTAYNNTGVSIPSEVLCGTI